MVRFMGLVACVVALSGCLGGDDTEDGAGGSGGSTKVGCAKIVECSMACDDDACTDACIARGTTAAQQQFTVVATCASEAQCSDMSCLWENCSTEATACGLKHEGGDGSLNCVKLDECVQGCDWDETCMQAQCFSKTDQATATVWMAVYQCADDNGCQDSACVAEKCDGELQACAHDGGSAQ
jgi:hypothetical protein